MVVSYDFSRLPYMMSYDFRKKFDWLIDGKNITVLFGPVKYSKLSIYSQVLVGLLMLMLFVALVLMCIFYWCVLRQEVTKRENGKDITIEIIDPSHVNSTF